MDLPEVLANIVSFMDDGSEFEEHRNWARSVPDGFFYQSPVWQFNALAQTSPLAYELCAPRARQVKKNVGVLFFLTFANNSCLQRCGGEARTS